MATVSRTDRRPERPTSDLLDRLPPQNLEAERGVVGSLLLDPMTCDDVALVVRPEDFYSDAHRILVRRMFDMHDTGRRIDALLLVEELKRNGELDAIGGVAGLNEIINAVPTAAHAAYYAEIVRDAALLRGLIHASSEIIRDAYDPAADPRGLMSRAEEKIFSIRDNRDAGQVITMHEALEEALIRIDQRMQNEHGHGGIESGYPDLDHLTGGFHPSELIVVAARPGMGKTALATNICEHVTLKQRASTLFVSLEMSRYELADRMLCAYADVNGHRLRNGTISREERQRLVEKASELSQAPLHIDDTPSRNVTEIAATARRLKRTDNLGLIIIDYLQLIDPDNARDPRQEQVAKITRRLKILARELKVPVMVLAQLNRQTEQGKGDGHKPKLSQLRESGAIEQDADMVLFVHRDEYYETDPDARREMAGEALIIVAKQRHGPTDEVKVVWIKDKMRFASRSHEWSGESF